MQVVVADTIKLLDLVRPGTSDQLRSRFPEARLALAPEGTVMGGTLLPAGLEATRLMLTSLEDACWDAVTHARRKLRLARILQLVAQLLSLASLGTLLKIISGDSEGKRNPLAVTIALVGFVSAAIPLAVEFLRRGLTDGGDDLQKQYVKLREALIEAHAIGFRLDEAASGNPPDQEAMAAAVNDANTLSGAIRPVLIDLGYDRPRARPAP
jgi:hypothetical protein